MRLSGLWPGHRWAMMVLSSEELSPRGDPQVTPLGVPSRLREAPIFRCQGSCQYKPSLVVHRFNATAMAVRAAGPADRCRRPARSEDLRARQPALPRSAREWRPEVHVPGERHLALHRSGGDALQDNGVLRSRSAPISSTSRPGAPSGGSTGAAPSRRRGRRVRREARGTSPGCPCRPLRRVPAGSGRPRGSRG
jgi:hypothetical protein